jgi:hypothetical protein
MPKSCHLSRFAFVMILFFAGCGGSASSDDADAQDQAQQDGETDAVDVRQDDPANEDPGEAPDGIQDPQPESDPIPDTPGEETVNDVPSEDMPPACSDMEGSIQNPDIWILQNDVGTHATFELGIDNPNPAGGSCNFSGIAIDQVSVYGGSEGTEITVLSEITPSGAPLSGSLAPEGSSTASYEAVDPYMSPVTFCGSQGWVKVDLTYIGGDGSGKTLSLRSSNVTITCE